jgi:hypothetical protein
MNVYYVTAIWLGMALVAAVVSIRVAVPAAEIGGLVVAGVFLHDRVAQQFFRPRG